MDGSLPSVRCRPPRCYFERVQAGGDENCRGNTEEGFGTGDYPMAATRTKHLSASNSVGRSRPVPKLSNVLLLGTGRQC